MVDPSERCVSTAVATCCKSLVRYTVHKVPSTRAPRLLYYEQVLLTSSVHIHVQTDRMIPLHVLVPSSTF
jgi:hypothetical protein